MERWVRTACDWEVTARKVGNVHPHRPFADMTSDDFLKSAEVISTILADRSRTVGESILDSVRATRQAVGKNTNLGIILALAPLTRCPADRPLRETLPEVLKSLTVEDCRNAYEAIRLAKPSGLAKTDQHDVNESQPTITLREAMQYAESRDLIARQYVTNYVDVLDFGLSRFQANLQEFKRVEAAIIDLQIEWLSRSPDTFIAGKCGAKVASEVMNRAINVQTLGGIRTTRGRTAAQELDDFLRSDGHRLNPGTTADLIAAVLYAALHERIVTENEFFTWECREWQSGSSSG